MMVWDPQQYLKFSGHRLRPAVDLLMRIPDFGPREIADLGAGTGNVTKLIRERWPSAAVTGVEGSAEMVAAGRKAAPDVEWSHEDLGHWRPAKQYDVVYSNAAQLPGAVACPDRRDRPERALAIQGRAPRDAAAGRGAGLLSRRTRPLVAKHRHLGDR